MDKEHGTYRIKIEGEEVELNTAEILRTQTDSQTMKQIKDNLVSDKVLDEDFKEGIKDLIDNYGDTLRNLSER